MTSCMNLPTTPKRKYHCTEQGCNKSFTTSGHLARHNRIHTGEKNFHCLHPGCPSRFSRQDNMMQHYRTHLTQKLRRQNMRGQQQQKKNLIEEENRAQLYRHSHHERENHMSLQPLLTTRPRRSVTMPSLPYPNPMLIEYKNRPRRALSTSSDCSTSSSASTFSYYYPPPPLSPLYLQQSKHVLPPPSPSHPPFTPSSTVPPSSVHREHHYTQPQPSQPSQQQEWIPNSQKPLSSLLHLANIVSTFG
ncbi:uncharacterized protein B0P05DRAFT_588169 [Gilbertella persicaria]|uniref:uncharacterized protein n=1 Tax=Gilbertella persicaria TaxID=101096 RepID=UPI00222075A7|nr:uncharacterized protein B0P05DRAFT_588169 [Gilbertella persicaria]KAI8076520.1 hypothetical protein B0P05DRAFT_588169 [Gilbertella persicaria]